MNDVQFYTTPTQLRKLTEGLRDDEDCLLFLSWDESTQKGTLALDARGKVFPDNPPAVDDYVSPSIEVHVR